MATGTKRKLWQIALVVIIALAAFVWQTIRNVSVDRLATELHESGRRESSPETTYEQARDWLERNEFEVVRWFPHREPGWILAGQSAPGFDYSLVSGRRTLRKKSLFLAGRTMELEFRFTGDGRFQEIYSKVRNLELE